MPNGDAGIAVAPGFGSVGEDPDRPLNEQEQDQARQELLRRQHLEDTLNYRLQQRAGLVPGGGEADAAQEQPEFADDSSRRGLAEARSRALAVRQRVQQAQQVAKTVQGAVKAARGLAVVGQALLAVGGFLVANAPIIAVALAFIVMTATIAYCVDATHTGECVDALGSSTVQLLKKAFTGTAGTTTPATAGGEAAGAGSSPPQSSAATP